ncbi:DNAH7 [Symbiodinium natans]|uniref:DNAH7 protein n=1 Tax=Symbiodinium natans TaxID=878477 RepID=A0A812NY49_9DINO|nr:DNAH7 [Symbiodinium natans]
MLKSNGKKITASLLSKLPNKASKSATSKSSEASCSLGSGAVNGAPPDITPEAVLPTTAVSGPEAQDSRPHGNIDPKLAAAVLIFAVLALWRPAVWMFLISVAMNLALGCALVLQASYAQRQRTLLSRCFENSERSSTRSESPGSPESPGSSGSSEAGGMDADVTSTCGLQQLLDPGWRHMREVIGHRDLKGILTQIELGDKSPRVTFVRSVNSPCEGVVCFDVGLQLLASSSCPFVQLEVPVPGYSDPWIFHMQLLQLDLTVQLYFWSAPPEGRGSGRSYSLIEAALSPEPPKPPMISVALKAVSSSSMLEQVLCKCEHVASAVICSHVLPRFTGFEHRVILEEGRARQAIDSTAWQQCARRAGWQPRAEAVVESAPSLVRAPLGTRLRQCSARH